MLDDGRSGLDQERDQAENNQGSVTIERTVSSSLITNNCSSNADEELRR